MNKRGEHMKITLYTSWEGQERFKLGQPFIAYAQTERAHMREFEVSKEYVASSDGQFFVIDAESDAVFT